VRVFRTSLVAVIACSAVLVSANAGHGAVASAKSDKVCATYASLAQDLESLGTAISQDFDGDALKKVAKTFKKASKSAPKALKSSLASIAKVYNALGNFETEADAVAEYAKNAKKNDAAFRKFLAYDAAHCESSATGSTGGASGGDSGGSVAIDGETVTLASARCLLREQTAAGQRIELTAQATGTNSDGDMVVVDFTRYAKDSDFAGDDISVDIGDPGADDATNLNARLDIGDVDVNGSTVSVSDVEFTGSSDGSTVTGSFEINC